MDLIIGEDPLKYTRAMYSPLRFLLLFSFFSSPLYSQVHDEALIVDIQQLYIGILRRAADQPGLDYWVNEIESGKLTLENTRASFTQQIEYASLYDGLDNRALVTAMYQNFLERDPDATGLEYWVSELDSGSVNPDQLVNALVNAVEDPNATSEQALADKSVLTNKVSVALYFTDTFSGGSVNDAYITAAQSSVSDVGSDASSVDLAIAGVDTAWAEVQTTGFNALFIGHSFFKPIAITMPLHAEAAGIQYHTQTVVFSGGATGAPEALWNNVIKSRDIRSALDAGGVDLFVMTYHGDYPTLTGYTNWISYALEKNPNTHVAIGLPWGPYPESTDSVSYGSGWKEAHTSGFHGLIDQLKALYPDTDIFCIPYGQSAVELRDLYAAGNLDDVEALVSSSVDSIYNDTLGHADDILLALSELVWLSAIYSVDLSTYVYEPDFNADIKAIAQDIMDEHDPVYDATYL